MAMAHGSMHLTLWRLILVVVAVGGRRTPQTTGGGGTGIRRLKRKPWQPAPPRPANDFIYARNGTALCSNAVCGVRASKSCFVETLIWNESGVECAGGAVVDYVVDNGTCGSVGEDCARTVPEFAAAAAAALERRAAPDVGAAAAYAATTSCRVEVAGGLGRHEASPGNFSCAPRIFVLGSHKSGTTALFSFLMRHARIMAGAKENNIVCDLTPRRALAYERSLGRPLVDRVEKERFAVHAPRFVVEGTPSNVYCRGLDARAALIGAAYRPKVLFLHRDPVARAWSDFTYFATFNDALKQHGGPHACRPTAESFAEIVSDQIRALGDCSAYWGAFSAFDAPRGGDRSADCDEELRRQLQPHLPYLPCTHLARLVPGFSRYLERRWVRALGAGPGAVLSLDMSDLRGPSFGDRVWRFLGLPRDPAIVPCTSNHARNCTTRPLLGAVPPRTVAIGGGKAKNFSFGSFDGVPIPKAAAENLTAFYRDFDTSVFDLAF